MGRPGTRPLWDSKAVEHGEQVVSHSPRKNHGKGTQLGSCFLKGARDLRSFRSNQERFPLSVFQATQWSFSGFRGVNSKQQRKCRTFASKACFPVRIHPHIATVLKPQAGRKGDTTLRRQGPNLASLLPDAEKDEPGSCFFFSAGCQT